jgi:hypothetical protein
MTCASAASLYASTASSRLLLAFIRGDMNFSAAASALALVAVVARSSAARAQTSVSGGLVSNGIVSEKGTGLGNVNTILTVQGHPANKGYESGCIAPGRVTSGCGFANLRVKTGARQSGTIFLSSLEGVNGSNLAIVLDFVEPGNALSGSLDEMVLTLYDNSGASLFSTTLGSSQFFAETFTGTGKSGFVFGLTPEAALAFDAATRAGATQLGLGAALSDVTGGHESFFVAVNQAVVVTPEPTTLALLATGLLVTLGVARRRRGAAGMTTDALRVDFPHDQDIPEFHRRSVGRPGQWRVLREPQPGRHD